jgi:polysaccharide export outer membrane protein
MLLPVTVRAGQEKKVPPPSDPALVPDDQSKEPIPEGEPLPEMPSSETTSSGDSPARRGDPSAGLGANYLIGPEDVLDIEVFDVPELHKIVRVSNDGVIALALIGRVKAAGLTTEQLRQRLEATYGESYLQKPQVTVFVTEFHAQPVSVIGAVEKPGLYQLTGPRTLIEILSMAGGLAKRSSAPAGKTLYVTRKEGFGDLSVAEGMQLVAPEKLEINISRLLYSHKDVLNIEIQPRDTISVTKADIVYVVGSVRKPGGFVLEDREKVTVMQALALAEGFFGSPAKSSARVIRRAPDGSRTEIRVNLTKVLNGKAEDVEMAGNDILFVPDSASKAGLRRGADAAIGTISGLLIYGKL